MSQIYDFDPCLLIAMPQMLDPNFNQTVSLLSEFNAKGAVALVLNRPLQLSLYDILSKDFRKQFELDASILKTVKSSLVYWGGPVDVQQGLILHTCHELQDESVEVSENTFLTGSLTVLIELIKRKTYDNPDLYFRFFLGYAGWEAKQLEQEIAESCWVTSDFQKFVFDTRPEKLWNVAVESLGVEVSQLTSVSQTHEH